MKIHKKTQKLKNINDDYVIDFDLTTESPLGTDYLKISCHGIFEDFEEILYDYHGELGDTGDNIKDDDSYFIEHLQEYVDTNSNNNISLKINKIEI